MADEIFISGHDTYVVTLPHEGKTFAYFFAQNENEIVAVAKADPWSTDEDSSEVRPFISAVHVCEELRGNGIGTGLMKYIERLAMLQGISSLALHVHKNNEGAKRLYERLGYRPVLDWYDDDIMFVKLLHPLEDSNA